MKSQKGTDKKDLEIEVLLEEKGRIEEEIKNYMVFGE